MPTHPTNYYDKLEAENRNLEAENRRLRSVLERIVRLNDLMPEDHPARLSHAEYEAAVAALAARDGGK